MNYNTSILKKRPTYLLAIMPSPDTSDLVFLWKQLLKKEIGEFGSDGSQAHFTVMGFDTDIDPLSYWITEINKFCDNFPTRLIGFDGFASFGFQTFYIKPDKYSRKYLNNLIRNLHQHFHFKAKNVNAHMTIARELDEIRIKKAFEFFDKYETNSKFLCDGFVLRKFNKKTGQYSDIISEFKFKEQQMKLF